MKIVGLIHFFFGVVKKKKTSNGSPFFPALLFPLHLSKPSANLIF